MCSSLGLLPEDVTVTENPLGVFNFEIIVRGGSSGGCPGTGGGVVFGGGVHFGVGVHLHGDLSNTASIVRRTVASLTTRYFRAAPVAGTHCTDLRT